LSQWLDSQSEVPEGRWFKPFPGMTICGEGELILTILVPSQIATGDEVK